MSTRGLGLGKRSAGRGRNRRFFGKLATIGFLLLLLTGLLAAHVLAHGGGIIRLTAASAGPYLLSVWVSPEDVKAGQELHVTSAVQLDGEPILDAEVLVQVMQADTGSKVQSVVATRGQSVNKLLYEADLTIQEPGAYRINVAVSGPDGQGAGAFAIEVQPAAGVSWWPVLPLGFVVILVIGWYRYRKRPSEKHIP